MGRATLKPALEWGDDPSMMESKHARGPQREAINGTSAVSNAVATLDTPFVNDPPTLADMELMRAKMNELILALRR